MSFPITEVDLGHGSLLGKILNMYYVLGSHAVQGARNIMVFLVLVLQEACHTVWKLLWQGAARKQGTARKHRKSNLPKLVMRPVMNSEGQLGYKQVKTRNKSIIGQDNGM